jgi:type I restriction enzyme S subunit
MVELGDVVEESQYGTSTKANDNGNGIPILRMNNITYSGSLDLRDLKHVQLPDPEHERYCVRTGDLLFNRTNSQELVGKMAVWNREECFAFAGYLVRMRLRRSDADPSFVAAWFNTPQMKALLRSRAKPSINMSNINATEILKFPLVLPPLEDQRRIAEVLDRAEALRAKRRAALALLDTLTQSIFLEMFGDPAQNSHNLPTAALGDLGIWRSGGTPPRERKEYFSGAVPWFSSGELNTMYVDQSAEHVSERAFEETAVKRVPRGALMLGMYDTAALKASIARVDGACNQAVAFANLTSSIADTVFVYSAISIGRDHFRRQQRGVRQKNLNLSMIREIRIPLPHISSQREFAAKVAATERVKAFHRVSLAKFDELFASLQHRAFRGEL